LFGCILREEEFQNPRHIALDSEDNILINDLGRQVFLKYDRYGILIDGYRAIEGTSVSSGPGANLLVLDKLLAPENGKPLYSSSLKLLNPDLEVLQVIGDKFYCLQEKDNGYKALYVYRMNWD